jgi:hypothetical protein
MLGSGTSFATPASSRMLPPRIEAKSFDGGIVFSATMRRTREELGDRITDWLKAHPDRVPVDTFVALSSDRRFHCQTVVIFWLWS